MYVQVKYFIGKFIQTNNLGANLLKHFQLAVSAPVDENTKYLE
jgi:hypothetical protein